MYRYDPNAGKNSEVPEKNNDHAMDALRYLISRLDNRRLAKIRKQPQPGSPAPDLKGQTPPQPVEQPQPQRPKKKWLSIYNEALWTRLSGGPGCDW
jgi:hypothetical protein